MIEKMGKSLKLRFGEVLLEYGVITKEQLNKALEQQIQSGGHIGSILREMGYLDDDSLLNFLSKQFNTSPVNLFETKVPPNILRLLPFEKVKSFSAFPVREAGGNVTLAMINPNDINTIQEVEFILGKRVEPVIVPSFQMKKAISYFEEKGYASEAFDGEHLTATITPVEVKTTSIYSLLKFAVENKATYLHITVGVPPSIRVGNEIKRLLLSNITQEQIVGFVQEILTREQKEVLAREKEIDFTFSLPGTGHFGINIYKQRSSITLSARFIKEDIPSINDLGLPEWISNYALKNLGFILITGPSGHGKTTTVSALIDAINSHRRCNIVTLEDPIEYLHKHKKSNINQREVGIDTDSFAVGLKHIFRQDPDVIVLSEMRDPESVTVALKAAESRHLVISTLNSQNTTAAVDKIIDFFPEHLKHQIRLQFADVFLLIFAQKLVPKKHGEGYILAWEKIVNSPRVENLLREGKTYSIRAFMQSAPAEVTSIDQCLAELYLNGEITFENGLNFSDSPAYYQKLVKSGTPG